MSSPFRFYFLRIHPCTGMFVTCTVGGESTMFTCTGITDVPDIYKIVKLISQSIFGLTDDSNPPVDVSKFLELPLKEKKSLDLAISAHCRRVWAITKTNKVAILVQSFEEMRLWLLALSVSQSSVVIRKMYSVYPASTSPIVLELPDGIKMTQLVSSSLPFSTINVSTPLLVSAQSLLLLTQTNHGIADDDNLSDSKALTASGVSTSAARKWASSVAAKFLVPTAIVGAAAIGHTSLKRAWDYLLRHDIFVSDTAARIDGAMAHVLTQVSELPTVVTELQDIRQELEVLLQTKLPEKMLPGRNDSKMGE
jgi:hypothetical protein